MKIWGDNPKVFGIYGQQSSVGKTTAKDVVASRKDEYTVSGPGKDFQTALRALRNIPDIRQDKVREISAKLDQGQYQIPAQDISESMLKILSGNEE